MMLSCLIRFYSSSAVLLDSSNAATVMHLTYSAETINYEVATISSIPQAQKYEEEMKIQMGGVCRQGIEKAENSNATITILLRGLGPICLLLMLLLFLMNSIWFLLFSCIMASSSTTNLRIIVSSVNDFPLNTLRPSPDVLVLVTLLSGGAAKGFDLE
ncbi:hypothetical protein MUK42_35820 [Musa troglodytarum]|uniref:Uncharacterized protein n=1 Tax=Musa troglodytarum TaxID=320322 RepID=A0A9E7HS05_9LILI|nr:hypothetical protein MUK42_35820 [Musa troglodytarum]